MLTPLVRLALAWALGIVAAESAWPVHGTRPAAGAVARLAALGLASAAGAGLARRRVLRGTDPFATDRPTSRLGLVLALAACALLGAARHARSLPVEPAFGLPVDLGEVRLRGSVEREPDRRDSRTDYVLRVDSIHSGGGERGGGDGGGGERGGAGWRPAEGRVLLQAARWPAYEYGDRLEVEAALETPPVLEDFDYRAYLARRGIRAIARRPHIERIGGGGSALRHGLLAIKDTGRRALRRALPEPESSLAVGILLGDARGIPARLDADFRTTNTSHVIAISGSNIALLVALLSASAGRLLGRREAVPAIIAVVAAYTALVGADAAVVRAAIMGSIVVLGDLAGRPSHAASSLAAAAFGMSLWNPGVLWDLGFQLSFAATLGLLVVGPVLRDASRAGLSRRFAPERAGALGRFLEEAVLLTVAAQITTWPIIAMQTGQVSLVALLANALIVPVQPAVMGLGGLTAAAGALWPAAGATFGLAAWPPIAWTIRIVERCADLPLASVAWRMPPAAFAAYFCLLPAALHPGRAVAAVRSAVRHARMATARAASARADADYGGTRPAVRVVSGIRQLDGPPAPHAFDPSGGASPASRRLARALGRASRLVAHPTGLAALAAACALVWANVMHQPDGLLHVHALDVGQGDAILVVSPSGRRMLVDGGPSPSAVLDGLGRRFAPWDRRLDIVVLTHPDADHVGGLPAVLDRYAVAAVVAPEVEHHTPDAQAWRAAVEVEAAAGALVFEAVAGMRIGLDPEAGVVADVLWPPRDRPPPPEAVNDHSVVLRLVHGRTTILLTGDIEAEVEARLVREGAPLAADVLKVAHHGSETSTTPDFLAAVRPSLAVISAGADNRFGHPTASVLERLERIMVRRTDVDGAVEIIGDGRALWVK